MWLKLASGRGDHELDELLGDLRLEAFGVAFFEPHHVGHHTSARAVRVRAEARRALPRAVLAVTRHRVDDLDGAAALTATVLRGPFRGRGQALVVHLALAR